MSLPPRAERVAAVRALMGPADSSVRPATLGIRAIPRRNFNTYVEPLIDATWPAVRHEPFYEKLRIGACDLYASAPYTVLFCATNAPLVVRLLTAVGGRLPVPMWALAQLGRAGTQLIGRVALRGQHKNIVLVAAFIMVVDHVLDQCMQEPPAERGRLLEAVIQGSLQPWTPELRLTRALAVAMAEGLKGPERAAFDVALGELFAWIHAEVRAMAGAPDPLGFGHHLPGIEGGIDGLLAPLARYASPAIRAWMVDVAMFMQVMDDYLDFEHDAASDRATPVTTGQWTFENVASTWKETIRGLEALVCASGHATVRWVRFIREIYVLMMIDVMEAMAARPGL